MRIGIDCQVLRQGRYTGIPNYVQNLKASLQKIKTNHEFVFFDGPKKRIPFWSAHVSYARMIKKANLDVFHGPANSLPLLWNMGDWGNKGNRRKPKTVITVHDLAIYKHPEWFPRGQWLATKIVVPASIRKAQKIIVPSQATKKDLQELFQVADDKIAVIPHGVEERFFSSPVIASGTPRGNPNEIASSSAKAQTPRNDKKYILFVGTLEPRKNLGRVIEAYAGLPEEIKNSYELWIAGSSGWNFESIIDNQLSIIDSIKWLGYISDDDLPSLYQNASLFVYPSLYEGFGLPVLEAMAAGVPVVTSKGSAMEEIIRGEGLEHRVQSNPSTLNPIPYGLFVDPYSVEEIREAMIRYLSPPDYRRTLPSRLRQGYDGQASGESYKEASHSSRDNAYSSQISAAGQERARQFTWEETARRTLEVYESAMDG